MGDIFINKALGLLSSDKQKERADGLADLKHALQQNRQSSKLQELNDKACHKIFESLFRFVAYSTYPGEGLWEPLSLDYTKSLTSLLRHPPHIEHLGDSEWEKLVDFCITTINLQRSDESQLSLRSGHRSVPDDELDSGDCRSTPARATPAPVIREKFVGDKNATEEILFSIQLLTASPGAPVQASAESILQGLTEFVRSPSILAGNAHQLAFSSINAVIKRVFFDQSDLVRPFLIGLVPVIRRLWATKLHNLKDELLVTLMLCTVILTDGVERPTEMLSHAVAGLAETMQMEYIRRAEKELLNIDEVIFYQRASRNCQPIYGPRLGSPRSEHIWTVIWVMSTLLKLSDSMTRKLSAIDDIIRDAISAPGARQICALQLIPFLEHTLDSVTKESLVRQLIPNIVDDSNTIASWSMIALTSIASGSDAKSPPLIECWPGAVELATRAFSASATSRSACKLIAATLGCDLLELSIVTKLVNSLLSSANLNGPSALSDASLELWALAVRAKPQISPGSAQNSTKQVCSWLREIWTIGSVSDRAQIAQIAIFARPIELLNLFLACTNRPAESTHPKNTMPLGLVGRAWFYFHENREILEYLFDIGDTISSSDPWRRHDAFSTSVANRQESDDIVVLELLRSKSETFLQMWRTMTDERSHHITSDTLQIFTSYCLACSIFTEYLPGELSSKFQDLSKNCESLWSAICEFLSSSHNSDFMQASLEVLAPIIPSPSCDYQSAVWRGLSSLLLPYADVLEIARQGHKRHGTMLGDMMDLDDHLATRNVALSHDEAILALNRASTPLLYDSASFQRCLTIQISFLLRAQPKENLTEMAIHSAVIEYLTGLDETDLLSAHSIMPKIYQECSNMSHDGLLSLLEDLGEKCLQSYETERCEAFHSVCIQMMTAFTASWAHAQDHTLSESAMDLYNWFLEVLLARKRASTRVYIALSELLQRAQITNPSYGNSQSLPSPRTSLFTILNEGDVQVKFSIAKFIPGLFDQFSLKDHDAIFDDVLKSLPRDPDWIEGIALRLFVLSRLASRWHTLLRRSIYHLFETPAHVPMSLRYAQKCVKIVSESLGLQNERQLFQLFASQILYTWTETQSVMSMPFSIFGYATLKQMLIDVKEEIVGQMMMRGKDSETEELANYIGEPRLEMLKSSFHKAEAYSISKDISTPPEQGSQPKGVEVRLRKLLGTEGFMAQIETQFPQIVANFFKSLDRYDQIERAYAKRPAFRYALDINSQISSRCNNPNPLPANQQPSFRARYLLDELDFLCKRTGFEVESIWTPALAAFYAAGPIMLQDYQFEMLLHALRPLLNDPHCCEDTLSIFWYLLEAGKPYLETTPAFMAGICISTFVTLRKLLISLESAPAESQLGAALENIRKFHQWLRGFVENFNFSNISDSAQNSLSRFTKLAQEYSMPDQPSKPKVEKELVFEVLNDRDSAQPLLSIPLAELVLSLLCPEFEQTAEGDDHLCTVSPGSGSHIVSLWNSLDKFDGGSAYRLWAARLIGRSFASTGKIHESLLREQDHLLFKPLASHDRDDIFSNSKTKILRILSDKLPMNDHVEAGLIELTLQMILNKIADNPDLQSCAETIPESLVKAFIWNPYICPRTVLSVSELERCNQPDICTPTASVKDWARNMSLYLSTAAIGDPVIGCLRKILNVIPELAVQTLPYIVHDVLLAEGERNGPIRQVISDCFRSILHDVREESKPHAQTVINCILYLRTQPAPQEASIIERDMWLDIDFGEASSAAHRCGLQKTSLLFLEIQVSRVVAVSRRSSVAKYEPPIDLLHEVFKNIDDPDLFYGIQQNSSLENVMERLEYEGSGFKNLLFQSAQFDSEIQMSDSPDPFRVLKALNSTNLQGIANTMLSAHGAAKEAPASFDSMLQAATNLQKWDVPVSSFDDSPSTTVFRAFQGLNTSSSGTEVAECVDDCLLRSVNSLVDSRRSAIQIRKKMRSLGILTEISDVILSASPQEFADQWDKIVARGAWLKTESYHEVGEILNWHEALFSSIKKNDVLKSKSQLTLGDSRLLEAKVFRQSLDITRNHGVSQASLKAAITLSKLAGPCAQLGIMIDGVTNFDLANVLWDQGEMTASIRMLQQLKGQGDLHKQAIPLSRSELLVTLGHHVAEARLEKPDSILQDYLYPAVKELKKADFQRVEQLRNRKEKELLGLEDMMNNAEGRERESLRMFRAKAKQWFDLDDREYQRLSRSREAFLQQCLENYLLTLRECDTYNNDVLRFCALWLDKSASQIANTAVSKHINQVASHKFAPLINQLSSRLLDTSDEFQSLLTSLVYKICVEHPFHGMYQIFASSKSKGGKDPSSHSRFRAANKLVDRLKNDKDIGPMWVAVHNMNITYVRFAVDKPDSKFKTGAKIPLKKLQTGERLLQDAATYQLPPPTMKIELRADKDYSKVPTVARFSSEFSIASGLSAPKIVTAIATDGVRYKQLYKGGNDDLRQDSIMEQVFEQVSSLLKDHQPTRQRNLGIRTYKVLPLTLNAGIIEFVPNTIPLHDYLMPAHQRYFPKDMKPSACRKHIADVQTRSFEQRVRTYRQVSEHFHPVMRYFFMEKFNNPDDWFNKRLAYTRSTAAISILGHVLGLGDRHGHNILLDEKTGEAVHIDLGVAFEQGRVLPVPEVVPFRLTRDLVDGFGITKTEGVFRRCCEFTLEALRQESYSIMTILDVLRYDPLYSWTVSPLRMKKMQDNQDAGDGPPVLPGANDKSSTNEPSEADRALTVVAKKLGKTLSVTATVNELIQQATDERNLAVLYCGWAAYA
ncbi:hypothetical protein N7470_008748 [Penicillium chermesinum]|nr:hypothetical protein N7470_008748 [Penicillium chermesinum]